VLYLKNSELNNEKFKASNGSPPFEFDSWLRVKKFSTINDVSKISRVGQINKLSTFVLKV